MAQVLPRRAALPSAMRALLHAASHGTPCVPLVAYMSAKLRREHTRAAWGRESTMTFKERVRRVTGVLGRTVGAAPELVKWFDNDLYLHGVARRARKSADRLLESTASQASDAKVIQLRAATGFLNSARSLIGGAPNIRAYSRLNCDTL